MHRVQNSAATVGPSAQNLVVTSDSTVRPSAVRRRPAQQTYSHTVHHGGNRYFATAGMAEIFRAKADLIVASAETELVPLLHSTGVDLLLVGPHTRFTVVAIEVGQHTAA